MSETVRGSVVIYGGGVGGAVLAKRLSRDLAVTLVDPHDYFEVPMAAPRNLVRPVFADQAILPFAEAMPEVEHIRGKLVKLTPRGGIVEYQDGSLGPVSADISVLATGSRLANDLMRASHGSASARKEFYERFNVRLQDAQRILIVGGGPIGVEFAGEVSETHPGKHVTIVESGKRLLAGTSAAAAAQAARVLTARGVTIITGERLEGAGRPSDGVFADGGEMVTNAGRTIPYDLIVWCTGGRPNTSYMASEFDGALDDNGRIRVTPDLRVVGQERLFAIGDITDLNETKMAAFVRGHVKVAEANIRALLSNSPSIRLTTYRAQTDNPLMAVTLGSRTGVTQLPILGLVKSAWLNRKAKAEKMLVPIYRKVLSA